MEIPTPTKSIDKQLFNSGCTIIKCGQLIDGRGNVPIKDGIIIIKDDTIIYIGEKDDSFLNRNVAQHKIIDLSECTVLPGLIDCHCKALNYKPSYTNSAVRDASSLRVLKGLKYLQDMLNSGWTTVRLLGYDEYLHIDLKDAISTGLFEGPQIITASHPICCTGGGTDSLYGDDKTYIGLADGVDEIVKVVRREVKFGSQWVAMEVNGAFSTPSNPRISYYSHEEISTIVEQSSRLRCPVMSIAHSPNAIKMSLAAGARSIEYGSFIDDEGIALMIDSECYLVPLLQSTTYAKFSDYGVSYLSDDMKIKRNKCIQKCIAAGVKIATGTGYYSGSGCNDHILEITELVRMGMTNLEAIASATSVASELLGLDATIGSLEPEKRADIIAVKGNLAEDISCLNNIVFVMSGGKVRKHTPLPPPSLERESLKGIYHIVNQQIGTPVIDHSENSLVDRIQPESPSNVFEYTNTPPPELFTKRFSSMEKEQRNAVFPWSCPRCNEENFGWIDSCIQCDMARPGVRGSRMSDEYESFLRSNMKTQEKEKLLRQESVGSGTPNTLARLSERRNRRKDKPY